MYIRESLIHRGPTSDADLLQEMAGYGLGQAELDQLITYGFANDYLTRVDHGLLELTALGAS